MGASGKVARAASGAGSAAKRGLRDWDLIERQYCAGIMTIARICDAHGMSSYTLYRRRDQSGWPKRSEQAALTPDEAKIVAAVPLKKMTPARRRKAMVVRMHIALDRQLTEIETLLVSGRSLTGADRERMTRQLGAMMRSMEKLSQLHDQTSGERANDPKGGAKKRRGGGSNARRDDEAAKYVRNPEQWRLALAERISRLREQWTSNGSDGGAQS